jgi:hypothetical protein
MPGVVSSEVKKFASHGATRIFTDPSLEISNVSRQTTSSEKSPREDFPSVLIRENPWLAFPMDPVLTHQATQFAPRVGASHDKARAFGMNIAYGEDAW